MDDLRYLASVGQLATTMQSLGLVPDGAEEPAFLLWGVPIPCDNQAAQHVRQRIEILSDSYDERPHSRSEPDIILDFGNNGIVVIEVKLFSDNDCLRCDSPKWNSYLHASDAFVDCEKAKRSGLYELVRNWRIAFDLAGNRPAKLINLGPETLWKEQKADRLELFRESLTLGPGCVFLNVSWRQLLGGLRDQPGWLRRYVSDRRIPA